MSRKLHPTRTMSREPSGLTLVEIIVCLAIIMILVAIVVPLYARSIREGYKSSEISNLHQLGVAAGIYESDHDRIPDSIRQVDAGGYVKDRSLYYSRLDITRNGYANRLIDDAAGDSSSYSGWSLPYPVTYIGPGDMKWDDRVTGPLSLWPNAGWLVSFTPNPSLRLVTLSEGFCRRLRRLTNEGLVILRTGQEADDGECIYVQAFADSTLQQLHEYQKSTGAPE